MFRDTPDVDAMKDNGHDLSSFADVKTHAEEIYARVLDGSMPCDDPWPKEQVALFKRWMEEGMYAPLERQPSFRHKPYPLSNACFFSNSL